LINDKDLEEIETFYNEIKNNYKYSQVRSEEFLKYRILNNPYNEYHMLKLYSDSQLCGYLIFNVTKGRASIEDVLFTNMEVYQELLNRLYNHIKINRFAYAITFVSLENSMLDRKVKGFFRRVNKNEGVDKFMLKNDIKDINKDDLKIENFYFTKLMMEGIS